MNIWIEKPDTQNRIYTCQVECAKESRDGWLSFSPKEQREKDALLEFVAEKSIVRVEAYWTAVSLVLDAGGNQKLVFRTQTTSDRVPLENIVPFDQRRIFTGQWEGDKLVFSLESSKSVAPEDLETARLRGISIKALKTEATERSVAWDNNASTDTMIHKIAAARPVEAA